MVSDPSRRRQLWAGTAILLAMSFASAAHAQQAQQSEQSTELKPIVLDAKKGGRVADSPLTETTERPKIEQRMVTDLRDFSRRIDAGVNFNSNTKSINIRGLQNERVLTTIDGIRLPWLSDPRDTAKGGGNAFDFDSLSSLDITKGADSSRYGSGALGGVVELRTLNPEDLIDEGKNFGALTKSTYDSKDNSIGSNAAVAGRFNDSWLLVQGGYKKGHETENQGYIDGYGANRTEANPMDFVQKNLLVKFHQYIEGGHRFGLTGELYNRDEDSKNFRGTTASYQQGSFKSGEEVDRKRISGSYDFISPDNSDVVDRASVTVYWQKEQINNTTDAIRLPSALGGIIPGDPFFYGRPFGVYKRDNMIEQTSYGLTGNASKELDLGGVSHELRFGGEIYWQDTHQYSAGVDNCPDVDWTTIPQPFGPQACRFLHTNSSDMADVNAVMFGAFVEDDIKLMDNRLTITPGLRLDYYSYDPKSTAAFERSPAYDQAYLKSNEDFGISPKLRFAWQATQELELYAQYARGFRAPTVMELYQNYGQPGSYRRIGNPNLDTETSNGFEVGGKYEAADYTIAATVFNNYYRNFIDTKPSIDPTGEYPLGITEYLNVNKVRIYGIELSGEWRFDENWRTWGSVAWSNGRNTGNGAYLNSVAPLRAIVGLGYAQETWGADVSLTAAATRNRTNGGFRAPGYGIVDLSAWWAPEKIGDVDVKGLKIQAGVFNVFDEKYWDAVSVPDTTTIAQRDYFSQPGRTFKVSVSKKF